MMRWLWVLLTCTLGFVGLVLTWTWMFGDVLSWWVKILLGVVMTTTIVCFRDAILRSLGVWESTQDFDPPDM